MRRKEVRGNPGLTRTVGGLQLSLRERQMSLEVLTRWMICSKLPFKRIILAAICKLDGEKARVEAVSGQR